MPIKRRTSFNPKSFLAKVGEGRSINAYRGDQILFAQGEPADAVFYLQSGKVKVTVVSELGKEAIVAMCERILRSWMLMRAAERQSSERQTPVRSLGLDDG